MVDGTRCYDIYISLVVRSGGPGHDSVGRVCGVLVLGAAGVWCVMRGAVVARRASRRRPRAQDLYN